MVRTLTPELILVSFALLQLIFHSDRTIRLFKFLGGVILIFLPIIQVVFKSYLSYPLLQHTPLNIVLTLFLFFAAFPIYGLILSQQEIKNPELLLFLFFLSLPSMSLLIKSTNLFLSFVAIEILSFCFLGLIYVSSSNKIDAIEAILRYFFIGGFSSGFMLVGMALILLGAGSLNFLETIHIGLNSYKKVGLLFFVAGLGFKVFYIPFQFWVPDIYKRLPYSIALFLSTLPKISIFGFLYQFLTMMWGEFSQTWTGLFALLSSLTMFVGNLMALRENNIKALMGFSTIAHAGYALSSFAFNTPESYSSLGLYLIFYIILTIGIFGNLVWDSSEPKNLLFFPSLLVFLLGLIGIPPTCGFMGKFYLFKSGFGTGKEYLILFGFINSVLSVYYYIQIFLKRLTGERIYADDAGVKYKSEFALAIVYICLILTIYLGIFPEEVYRVLRFASSK